jgi:hypothetical protein
LVEFKNKSIGSEPVDFINRDVRLDLPGLKRSAASALTTSELGQSTRVVRRASGGSEDVALLAMHLAALQDYTAQREALYGKSLVARGGGVGSADSTDSAGSATGG